MSSTLPAPLTSFIGRESELSRAREVLDGNRLLTVTGPGGSGKTRFALALAPLVAQREESGVTFIDLAAADDTAAVLVAMSAALDVPASPGRSPEEALVDQLRDEDILLLVDNCEQVSEPVADVLERVLNGAPGVRALATSRRPLAIAGEVVWKLAGLLQPDHPDPSVEEALSSDAVRLFVARAELARPGFTLDAETVSHVVRICRMLDGVPLAIELAAARHRSMSLSRLADGMDDALSVLDGRSSLTRRHQALGACIDWSHRLLTPGERATFRRLSVFRGGFTVDAAIDVCSAEDGERSEVVSHLSTLVDQSLIVHDAGPPERFRLLETIRQFADARLVDADEQQDTVLRHLDHHASLAGSLAPMLLTGAQLEARLELVREEDNLRAAMTNATMLERPERVASLAFDLTLFWYQTGRFHEASAWIESAMDQLGDEEHALAARLLWGLGYLNFYFGNFAASAELAAQAVERAALAGDDLAIGRSNCLLAHTSQLADPIGQHARLIDARAASEAAGDQWGMIDAAQTIAVGLVYRDRHDEARAWLDEVWPLVEADGNPLFNAWHWNARLWGAARRGEDDRIEVGERALAAAEASGDDATITWAVRFLAVGLSAGGEHERALGLLQSHLAARSGGGVPLVSLAFLWLGLGACNIAIGDYERASNWTSQMLNLARVQQLPLTMADVLHDEIRVQLATEDPEAGHNIDVLTECAGALGNDHLAATASLYRGMLSLQTGDPVSGRTHALNALEALHAGGFDLRCWGALDIVAWASVAGGDSKAAGRWSAAAAAERERRGWATSHPIATISAATRSAAKDEEAFETGSREGAALSLADAIALARRGRGARLRPEFGWESLTPTERAVVASIAKGLTNPQIAQQLFISRSTVKTHLAHIFAKLGVSTRTELAAQAVAKGFE